MSKPQSHFQNKAIVSLAVANAELEEKLESALSSSKNYSNWWNDESKKVKELEKEQKEFVKLLEAIKTASNFHEIQASQNVSDNHWTSQIDAFISKLSE